MPARIAAALGLAAAAVLLGPWKDHANPWDRTGSLAIRKIDAGGERWGDVRSAGTWRLDSIDGRFGGYSGLTAMRGGSLVLYSDKGTLLDLRADPAARGFAASLARIDRAPGDRDRLDVEAATRDPVSGKTWLAIERINQVRRYDAGRRFDGASSPPAMKHFPKNEGAESLVRLPDGRFVVLSQTGSPRNPGAREGLLFRGDPVADFAGAVPFFFVPPPRYDPSDAVALPDGRVLILLRAIAMDGWPPVHSRLVIADSARIRTGKPWPWREIADLDALAPRQVYEGLAAARDGDRTTVWLVSDSNSGVLLLHTLLVKLEWTERSKGATSKPRDSAR